MNNTENKQKGRFAPSPTGRMHLGNVFSALLSWLSAKSQGGTWLLRIEDIDPQRSKQEYAELIMDDLHWLGLDWDEGPYYQSERGDIYEHYLKQLTDNGLTYPCYCTRADILATQAPQSCTRGKDRSCGNKNESAVRRKRHIIIHRRTLRYADNRPDHTLRRLYRASQRWGLGLSACCSCGRRAYGY